MTAPTFTHDRPLTDNERTLLTHVTMFGSSGYPVRKVGSRHWSWSCPAADCPLVFKTKREAVQSFENYLEVLRSCKAAERYRQAVAAGEIVERCIYKVGHAGKHAFGQKSNIVLLGDCGAVAEPTPVTEPTALYSTDNGRVVCGDHLGSCARHTGYDISGQAIMRIDAEYVALARSEFGYTPVCEQCGREVAA